MQGPLCGCYTLTLGSSRRTLSAALWIGSIGPALTAASATRVGLKGRRVSSPGRPLSTLSRPVYGFRNVFMCAVAADSTRGAFVSSGPATAVWFTTSSIIPNVTRAPLQKWSITASNFWRSYSSWIWFHHHLHPIFHTLKRKTQEFFHLWALTLG